MIITKIQHGLGNQLFQYALGKNLALKNKTGLRFDVSFFNEAGSIPPRYFLLDKFNVGGSIISKNELAKIKINNLQNRSIHHRIIGKIFKIIEEAKPIKKRRFVSFNDIVFYPEILQIETKKTIYLAGNWLTEKYFLDIKNIIKKDITLKNEMSEKSKAINTEINQNIAVSIHIRRGDYVQNEKTKNLHGNICTLEYYKKATKLIEEKINDLTYFIFSDDIEWVKQNLKLDNPMIFVSGQNIPDYEELILMSHCQHNIIANSTFSWWGAWLNANPEKIVIAPKKWFNSDTDTRDLIPDAWIKI